MWNFISKLFNSKKWQLPTLPGLKINDTELREVYFDGTTKSILWSDLQTVDICTTEDGPFFEDLFYILSGNGVTITISQLAAARHDLLKEFDRLQGFNWEAALQAMTCVQARCFLCWNRDWQTITSTAES